MAGNLNLIALLVTVTIGCTSSAVLWPDLRVKYDLNAFQGFHKIGRTQEAALTDNQFVPIAQESCVSNHANNVTFNGFRVKDPQDAVLSLLYDRNGVIAGIQAWFNHSEILTPGNPFRYDTVPLYQNVTEGNTTYFVATAYFVLPESICEEGRTEEDLAQNGTGTGVWLQQGPKPSDAVQVPPKRNDAIAVGWTKNSCFPGMGRHNFFEVEKYQANNCTESEGVFLLFNNQDELNGFGFRIQGIAASDYVEYPPNLAIAAILGEPVPPCILEQNTLFGSTTMHVFFTSQPWTILCPLY